MRDARVEEVEHMSDSDSEERDSEQPDLTVGIFPSNQGPTYLLCPGKQVSLFEICISFFGFKQLRIFFIIVIVMLWSLVVWTFLNGAKRLQ